MDLVALLIDLSFEINMFQSFFENSYKRANNIEDLPWYRDYPPRFLTEVIQENKEPSRALDIECGTGTYSTIIAQAGYEVIGIDFVAAALDMARERAADAKVSIQFQQADACDYQSQGPFDLVLDSGCPHSLKEKEKYRQNLLSWLQPGGQFILVHFNKRHFFDWRPIGPHRWNREQVEEFLGSQFQLRDYHEEIGKVPFPVGPTALISTYWFKRG